jgi:hypothetical protein
VEQPKRVAVIRPGAPSGRQTAQWVTAYVSRVRQKQDSTGARSYDDGRVVRRSPWDEE